MSIVPSPILREGSVRERLSVSAFTLTSSSPVAGEEEANGLLPE